MDFYDDDQTYLGHVLQSGDIILLVEGGHGTTLEEIEMFEIKQGPFIPEDKVKFQGIPSSQAQIAES